MNVPGVGGDVWSAELEMAESFGAYVVSGRGSYASFAGGGDG